MINLERLRTLSKEKGLSLSYICSQLGVARVYFIDVERHNRAIPEDRMKKIADLLGTTVEYLTDESDDPAPKQKKPDAISDELWNMIQNDPKALVLLEMILKMTPEQRGKFEKFLEGI